MIEIRTLTQGAQSAEEIAGGVISFVDGAQRSLDVALYDCVRCQSSMAGVLADNPADELWAPAAMTRRQEQGGHRRNGYVVGSRVDVALRPPGAEDDLMLIPATPNFFEQYRYV